MPKKKTDDEGYATFDVSAPVEPDPEPEVKCDNHPDVAGTTYTGGGAFRVNLCEACTPPWFKDKESAR